MYEGTSCSSEKIAKRVKNNSKAFYDSGMFVSGKNKKLLAERNAEYKLDPNFATDGVMELRRCSLLIASSCSAY